MFKGFIWNIPNALTLFRLVSIVLCAVPLLPMGTLSSGRVAFSLWFFVFGAVSDFLDGWFARRLNQTSDWGAYMDPLIDKILIWALYGLFVFIPFINVPWWLIVPIILRDILVTQMRNIASRQGFSFKTSFLAKSKTAVQMVIGVFILCYVWLTLLVVEGHPQVGSPERMWAHLPLVKKLPFYLSAFVSGFTVLTLFDYLISFARSSRKKAY